MHSGHTKEAVLPPQAQSASRARRFVSDFLTDHDRDDLTDAATLLVSEVVTNAVLHAATQMKVICALAEGQLQVSVKDYSTVAPHVRTFDSAATTGRGLDLVELLSQDWGVVHEERAKVIWFALGERTSYVEQPESDEPVPESPTYGVQFNAVPLRLAEATVQSTEALLREVMLMSIADDRARHTAEWAGCGIDLGPLLNALEQATGDTTDVVVHFPKGSGAAAMRRLALAEEGQRLALEGKLLSPPSLPEIDVCRQWLMNQIAVQEGLGDPVAWQMPSSLATLRPPSGLSEAERQRYDQQSDATVLVDDGHAIMYVNTAATALLGWNRAELMGQRLVKLIPPELHDAHLGGFMRYLLTSTPKIMHRDVELPVVRGDGTRATFGFHIQPLKLDNQRTAFHAHVWELSDTPS